MLSFRDFVPQLTVTRAPGFFADKKTETFESFDDAVKAASAWLEGSGARLVQIETVVLPNIWSEGEEGSADVSLTVTENLVGGRTVYSTWHQFVRVWYMPAEQKPYR